jgi:hypothetical protein
VPSFFERRLRRSVPISQAGWQVLFCADPTQFCEQQVPLPVQAAPLGAPVPVFPQRKTLLQFPLAHSPSVWHVLHEARLPQATDAQKPEQQIPLAHWPLPDGQAEPTDRPQLSAQIPDEQHKPEAHCVLTEQDPPFGVRATLPCAYPFVAVSVVTAGMRTAAAPVNASFFTISRRVTSTSASKRSDSSKRPALRSPQNRRRACWC